MDNNELLGFGAGEWRELDLSGGTSDLPSGFMSEFESKNCGHGLHDRPASNLFPVHVQF